jgi:hypothetical protein
MIGGDSMSVRERGRTRARMGRALLGRTGVSEHGHGRDAAGPRGWAEPERERREAARSEILFFFFKNMNSSSICLFH